jgi:hypothetical protein
MNMVRHSQQSPSTYAVVIVSAPVGSDGHTVFAALRRGPEKIWSVAESAPSRDPVEAALVGVWRILGEAVKRKLTRIDVFVSDAEAIDVLERRAPAQGSRGLWYLRIRSRCNQLGRVRFVGVGQAPPADCRRRTAESRAREVTLFDDAVA